MRSKASRAAAEMDVANKAINTPVCGNCDQYVPIQVLKPRSKKQELICILNGKHMNPALIAGCPYHQANRYDGQLEAMERK